MGFVNLRDLRGIWIGKGESEEEKEMSIDLERDLKGEESSMIWVVRVILSFMRN